MTYRCAYGEHVAIVGGHEKLGQWVPKEGLGLTWADGDEWRGELTFEPGTLLEYKYVVRSSSGDLCYWKGGGNVVIDVKSSGGSFISVTEDWHDPSRQIEVYEQGEQAMDLGSEATRSIDELRSAMVLHKSIQQRSDDPAALEVLQADRLLAAANSKAVAMNKALKAAAAFPQLPGH